MIDEIKQSIAKLKGKKIKIIVDIGRNKVEIYEGIVTSVYNNVWVVTTKNDIKCFGYSDILINNVKISS